MAVKKIIIAPHPTLRKVAEPIQSIDKKVLEHIDALQDTLKAARNPRGVGLAAPQIDTSRRIFATWLETSQSDDPIMRIFINPRVIDRADRSVIGVNPRDPELEGCLSIPHLYGPVSRPEWVTLEFQTLAPDNTLSDLHTETFFDFAGRVMQHELDHLDGILFTDYLISQSQPVYHLVNGKLQLVEPELAKGL